MAHGRAHGLGLRKEGEICTLRLYPATRRGLYIRVRVFESLHHYRRYATSVIQGRSTRAIADSRGCFCPYRVGRVDRQGRRWPRKIAGELLLIRGWLSINVVAHECAHAAHATVPRRIERSRDAHRIEEYRCRTVGWLTSGLLHGLQSTGLT